jgi:hypothetical protein
MDAAYRNAEDAARKMQLYKHMEYTFADRGIL